jgi:hypothetical protein
MIVCKEPIIFFFFAGKYKPRPTGINEKNNSDEETSLHLPAPCVFLPLGL